LEYYFKLFQLHP